MGEDLVVAVVLTVAAAYLTWTATRIDRLHERVDAAERALALALRKRHEIAVTLARGFAQPSTRDRPNTLMSGAILASVHRAREAAPTEREAAENALSAVLRQAADTRERPAVADLIDAGAGLGLARQFHSDAVRDTRAIRWRPVARAFRLGGDRPIPAYFEIDPGIGSPDRSSIDRHQASGNTVDTDIIPPEEGR